MAVADEKAVNPSKTLVTESPLFTQARSSLWGTIGWLVFLFLVSLHFTFSYNAIPDYLDLNSYTRGLSPAPYQYRMLLVFVFRLLVERPFILRLAHHAPSQFHDPHQIVQLGLTLVSMIGTVLATCGTLRRLTGDRVFARWFSLLAIYMAYFNLAPIWGLSYSYPYDTPSLFFFSLGMYLIVSERLVLYYVLLPFAILNRETVCFLILFFLIWRWRAFRERFGPLSTRGAGALATHGLVQAAIWLGLRRYELHLFTKNAADSSAGGAVIKQKLLFNLHELVEPQQWPVLLSCCGFLLPALWLQRRWINNSGVAWSCAVILPLWFVGMMLVGVITEIRVFSECTTFVVPALALIVHNRFRPIPEYPRETEDNGEVGRDYS